MKRTLLILMSSAEDNMNQQLASPSTTDQSSNLIDEQPLSSLHATPVIRNNTPALGEPILDTSREDLLLSNESIDFTIGKNPDGILAGEEIAPPFFGFKPSRDLLDTTFHQEREKREREWTEAGESVKADLSSSVRGSFDLDEEIQETNYPIPHIFRRINTDGTYQYESGSIKELCTPAYSLKDWKPKTSDGFSDSKDGYLIDRVNLNNDFVKDREEFVEHFLKSPQPIIGSEPNKQIFNDLFHTAWKDETFLSKTGDLFGNYLGQLCCHSLDFVTSIPNVSSYFLMALGHFTTDEAIQAITQLKNSSIPGVVNISIPETPELDGSQKSADDLLTKYKEFNNDHKKAAENYYSFSTKINSILNVIVQQPLTVILGGAGMCVSIGAISVYGPSALEFLFSTLGYKQPSFPSPTQVLDMNSFISEQQKTTVNGTALSKEDLTFLKNIDLRYIAFRQFLIKLRIFVTSYKR